MMNLINKLKLGTKLIINNFEYQVKTKTWYTIEEDNSSKYIKCELTNNKVLVVIPDDNLIYIGEVINNLQYKRLSPTSLQYENKIYNKTGDGNQYVLNIEFGELNEVEGKCQFEDFESEDNIISLGILTDSNKKADVFAQIIDLDDIELVH